MKKVLIVDDSVEILSHLTGILQDKYRVFVSKNEEDMWAVLGKQAIDLILLDINLGDINGLDLLQDINKKYSIPVIMITTPSQENEIASMELGAVDFITKPINPTVFHARLAAHLEHDNEKKGLQEEIETKSKIIYSIKEATIMALINMSCIRDNETGNHLIRTQKYVRNIAIRLVELGIENIPNERIELFEKCAPLHDIGKVGIADNILLKPGKLTPEEFEVMKLHTVYGAKALKQIQGNTNKESLDFLIVGTEIAECHHEKWDGSGYPQGLSGKDIPLSARIMAVADVYDALISVRPYKKAFTHQEALEMIQNGHGKHFDPEIVDAFMSIEKEVEKIAQNFKDN
jgi:putative two-component system response regulator